MIQNDNLSQENNKDHEPIIKPEPVSRLIKDGEEIKNVFDDKHSSNNSQNIDELSDKLDKINIG